MPPNIKEKIKSLKPSLINSYTRKYYQSMNKKYRITIDTNLNYYYLSNNLNTKKEETNKIVIELKYQPKNNKEVEQITNQFPFRLEKNSKYATGINLIKY